ncbi:rhodanese-like domain-containing protein [Mameliella sediminis]|uniref:rhodanese-like domain-containing protein n=1 Tax=Mameliella sediminis TaxID=2836866 RepID=UPI001C472321|nr:rhodanese-like domain-containing protein [Mameliella sediminis]MBV7392709.1 rhodanese-like domain-containing protein [Mameliella sediminis]MBY6163445.1 rhodanese-like domain-containing protein [Mameliella alba]MBY6171708.1 rhodanese-like domain-containing protein [Mameliella alba]MBY6176933.1 rhodanese-like domain-containing protein [Mameliella alba]
MRYLVMALGLYLGANLGASPVAAGELEDEIIGYMDFATETAGIILPQQLTAEIWEGVYFVDTRSRADFEAGTIPGAVHIEWRDVPGRLDEIPEDKMVVLFCNTGVRSSQATFAARVMGRENVLVMQSGYEGWLTEGAYHPR